MREIKFRAWNPQAKKMSKVFDLEEFAYDQDGEVGRQEFCLSHYHFSKGERKDIECILMQYTGIKDKNNIEIFEGDILFSEFSGWKEIPDNLQIVEWKDSEAGFIGRDNKDFRLLGRLHPYWWNSRCEVIGNVYQNKDLLK